ncbi:MULTISPECIES: hypothetical protein [Thiorhodovibrio]|nr:MULTISPECIES: hypothetical protein [Thiorhodovibrio]WPL11415.1 hypothetical protein Thiosp_01150 [Thiorhodovibrio litoralis]
MTPEQADEKLAQIERLAQEIEDDAELAEIDERYRITAKWIDTDIECVSA